MTRKESIISILVIVTDIALIMSGVYFLVDEKLILGLMSWAFALLITYLWANIKTK